MNNALASTFRSKINCICLIGFLATSTATVHSNGLPTQTAEQHAAAGMKLGLDFPGLLDLCDLSKPFVVAGQRAASAERPRPESRRRELQSPLPPMKVFDNLYFVGNRQVSAWLLGTDEGYFLIDAMNNDQQSKTIIEAGILKLGLDPRRIKYIVVTHAHGDHYGGQNYIATTYGPRVAMSEADWQVLEDPAQRIENPRWGPRPSRDVVVKDGDVLSIPGTEIQIRETPGHTPGTISLIFKVIDNGTPHMAALWGGTGFNFGANEPRFRQYAQSAERFGRLATKQGVDVFLSNHASRDDGIRKMERLQRRSLQEANPFVIGSNAPKAFEILNRCALAQAERVRTVEK